MNLHLWLLQPWLRQRGLRIKLVGNDLLRPALNARNEQALDNRSYNLSQEGSSDDDEAFPQGLGYQHKITIRDLVPAIKLLCECICDFFLPSKAIL